MYISPVILKFRKHEMKFNISAVEEVWIVSIMDFGNLLSAIPGGLAMDKCGRKYTLLLSAVIYLTASIFAIFATAGKYLFAARLLAGIGKGFSFTVAPIYVSEISSKNVRGALSSTFYGFFCAGVIVAAGIGPYVSYQELNYIGLALTTVFVILMLPMPESMYYYIMRNKPDKAEKALRWFRHTKSDYQKVRTDPNIIAIPLIIRVLRIVSAHTVSSVLQTYLRERKLSKGPEKNRVKTKIHFQRARDLKFCTE